MIGWPSRGPSRGFPPGKSTMEGGGLPCYRGIETQEQAVRWLVLRAHIRTHTHILALV